MYHLKRIRGRWMDEKKELNVLLDEFYKYCLDHKDTPYTEGLAEELIGMISGLVLEEAECIIRLEKDIIELKKEIQKK